MATEQFDLIIIGGGPGGYVGAIRAGQLGLKTACVEKRKALGGTCLNIGCIPSKALLESSEHFHHARTKFQKHGILVSDVKIDLPQMMKRKDAVVRQLTNGIGGLFKKNGVENVNGKAELVSVTGEQKQVRVELEGGTVRMLQAPRVMLATGSEPVNLPFIPFDGKRVLSSTEALSIPEVPKHLVVIGGGVIGLELGSVWLRLGAKVTVVEFMDRIVPFADPQVGAELHKALSKQGMEFKLATKCLGSKSQPNGLLVEVEELASGTKSQIECDYVLVATGRKPYSEGLGLEKLGIKKDKAGRVEVDAHYQTDVPGLYAVGDLIVGPMLAHKAEEEGIAAVELMAGQAGHVNYNAIPSVVYTSPELASVGATEDELKAKGVQFKTGSFPFTANGRAKCMEDTEGLVKIIADSKTDRVLGVHMVGPRVSELIAEAVSVIEFGGSAEDIARTCHAHPTLAEVVKEAAMAVDKRAIHM
ncbi:MAG TPA: dihydrolipoyl dehydrogenase [Bdellovibrionales bacterium]|nr:MAG: dihydrolipoyl dehydrogenase [Bdellovibrionales bacterium GWB1_52_6]OFZ03261.1 MAG: dihydrolipoyl dehydrogenase [Bdellovibrionales bacterium GWA1_52_35]OFZ40676.1 MAG: dihydrolipoyl dehydrogenase [Bdellovibrionales bacterium GWC1_52_8]HAR44005.1 dihydrolipoyl dehydrogenase [Bdellovibrionales bacterium]HCM40553.1 dihydrolipoyl dehydrogenase [Bdellovibrionales bacterium]